PDEWPALREWIAARFRTRSRNEWAEVFGDSDACVAPVLSVAEAAEHPHLTARGSFVDHEGAPAPASAPRFSRTPGTAGEVGRPAGADTEAVLGAAGYSDAEIKALIDAGVVATDS
ncbi:MAG: CoA transferase, partial [Micromonosporaceae bacterium]|nr:CoA transferase [Micromonosporaceae bacterium]